MIESASPSASPNPTVTSSRHAVKASSRKSSKMNMNRWNCIAVVELIGDVSR